MFTQRYIWAVKWNVATIDSPQLLIVIIIIIDGLIISFKCIKYEGSYLKLYIIGHAMNLADVISYNKV